VWVLTAWLEDLNRLVADFNAFRSDAREVSLRDLHYLASVLAAEGPSLGVPGPALAQVNLVLAALAEAGRRRGDQLVHLRLAEHLAAGAPEVLAVVRSELAQWHLTPRVFVSYARLDMARAVPIVADLKRRGADVHWDNQFTAGDISANILQHMAWVAFPTEAAPSEWAVADMVRDALTTCGVFLVLWSRHYASRPWTQFELRTAFEHCDLRAAQAGPAVRVVFVRLDEEEVPEVYAGELWVEARVEGEAAMEGIARGVFGETGRSA
jgi:hypothetical protein